MNLMAEEIETLKNYSLKELEERLEKMSSGDFQFGKLVMIEIDGSMYEIPEPVNTLLNSLYRMYKEESKKNKPIK